MFKTLPGVVRIHTLVVLFYVVCILVRSHKYFKGKVHPQVEHVVRYKYYTNQTYTSCMRLHTIKT